MYYLGIDTSNKYLIISIFSDEEVVYFKQEKGKRNASERCNILIKEAFESCDIMPKDLKAIVVTRGPGSFTGVRIGMSIAKVLAMTLDIDLYSLSSLEYFVGLNTSKIILDARSKKVFLGEVNKGKLVSEELVSIDSLDLNLDYLGDTSLINQIDNYLVLKNHFLDLKESWIKESYFDAKPTYLKSNI